MADTTSAPSTKQDASSSSSPSSLSPWPPALSPHHLQHLAHLARDYALSHGLVYRPLPREPSLPPPDTSAIHAPISLLPSPLPAHLFRRATHDLQPLYNRLYAAVALDDDFLERVIGGRVAEVDEFQAKLLQVYRHARDEGPVQPYHLGLFRSDYLLHSRHPSASSDMQALELKQVEFNTISSSFGPLCQRVNEMHRYLSAQTDYFNAHDGLRAESPSIPVNRALETLAGGLADAHRLYVDQQAQRPPRGQNLAPQPVVLFVVQEGERNAFDQRCLEYELLERHHIRSVRFSFEQLSRAARLSSDSARRLLLEPSALEGTPEAAAAAGAPLVEVSTVYLRAGYAPTEYGADGAAWEVRLLLERSAAVKCPTAALQLAGAKKVQQVLAVAGVLEAMLARADVERLPRRRGEGPGDGGGETWSVREAARELRESFTELYSMDEDEEDVVAGLALDAAAGVGAQRGAGEHDVAASAAAAAAASKRVVAGYELAMREPQRFVLKPQREGGGNNIYRHDIVAALRAMEVRDEARRRQRRRAGGDGAAEAGAKANEVRERHGYILMSLIQPPAGLGAYMLRAPARGTAAEGLEAGGDAAAAADEVRLAEDVVSELGSYGTALFRRRRAPPTTSSAPPTGRDDARGASAAAEAEAPSALEVHAERSGGFLLRTKGRESDEGGVAVGFSVIDSPVLVGGGASS